MYGYICAHILIMTSLGVPDTCTRLVAPPEGMGAPSSFCTLTMSPTSIVYSWDRPLWTQDVIGYSYILFLKGMLMHSGVVEATQTSFIIRNLSPDTNGYDFRVAGVLPDGSVGEYSSPLIVRTPKSSK